MIKHYYLSIGDNKMKNKLIAKILACLFLASCAGTALCGEDVIAVLTGEKGMTIEPQKYISKDIVLKKPLVIKGRVTDRSGEGIASVKLYVTTLLDYNSFESVTDNDGYYELQVPANETATTYRLSIQFLPGEFEADSTKIFAELDFTPRKVKEKRARPSSSLCLNELVSTRGVASKDNIALSINIAHQKESVLAKKPEEAAEDVVRHKLNPSLSLPIKERLIARLEEMRKIYPDKLVYFEALGLLQYELRDVPGRNYKDASINRLRQALKLKSVNLEIYRTLIDLLSDRGFDGESIQVAVKALTLVPDTSEGYKEKEDFKWLIERAKFNAGLKEEKKVLTKEEKQKRTDWALTLIEDQREVYRKNGYPQQFKRYELREGIQEEWWYYTRGFCFVFLNGMLNTKTEF